MPKYSSKLKYPAMIVDSTKGPRTHNWEMYYSIILRSSQLSDMASNRNPWHSSPKYFRDSISDLSRWKYMGFSLLTIQSKYAWIPVILSKKAHANKRPEVPSAFIPHLISIWKANSWNGINALNPLTFIRRSVHGETTQNVHTYILMVSISFH